MSPEKRRRLAAYTVVSLGFVSPEPTECIGQDRAAMVRVVAAVSENETKIVPTFCECGSYS